ncbi:hypothetical protein BDK51DRAFT_43576 [Blyttiomyces helicus]|uniref:Uncharacterized protein n=1 Tax=Blyttiomyces helicus TaxID=388810 RepID=A0A4V1ISM7_9FUNG|nr:hypothetical protein BDK51DRAFT_43576 [Blyttiomyces helicus]|eukprot:RKO94097.1 hypothetical protein BDK51DRAFT_43576 [Blyttiomyces helicus]
MAARKLSTTFKQSTAILEDARIDGDIFAALKLASMSSPTSRSKKTAIRGQCATGLPTTLFSLASGIASQSLLPQLDGTPNLPAGPSSPSTFQEMNIDIVKKIEYKGISETVQYKRPVDFLVGHS